MATITITVTVSNPGSGNKYYLDGVLQATYVATPGNTYKFDQADGSNSGHPLRLSITSDGTHNSGSAYTTGVTTSGTPGNAGAYTQIEVTATTVQALYYYCTAHSGMGGSFNTGSSATVQFQDRKGFDIQNFSADQTSVGQIYYNTSSGSFKAVKDGGAPIGTWASGASLNTARGSNAGFGTQDAAITAGGATPSASTLTETELYNGTSWTEVSDLNTGRQAFGSLGTSNAGFCVAGTGPPGNIANVEVWNGSGWTETTDVNTARTSLKGCGTTTAALAIGGYNPSPAYQINITESWNGSAWTEVNDMNTRRSGAGNALSSPYSDTIIFGGYTQPPPNTANAETWNGSSWTEVTNLNSAKDNMGGSGDSSTSALCFGGRTIANTESWNGSSWTEVADLALARGYVASAGSATSALCSGGEAPGSPYYRANTEEWTAADFEIKTVTTS